MVETRSSVPSVHPKRRSRAERLRLAIFLGPILLLLIPGFVIPLVLVLSESVTSPSLGLHNFVKAWGSVALRNILAATLYIAFWTTLVCLIMGFPVSYWLTTLSPRPRRLFLLLIVAPLFMAILARLYAWTILLGRRGVINSVLLENFGRSEPLDLLFNEFSVIVGMVHVLLPYMVIILYTVMHSLPPDLVTAARSLGAGPLQAFRRVYLPMVMPGVFGGCLLVFVLSLGFFTTPAILGGGQVITIPTYIERQMAVLALGNAATSALVLLVLALGLFYFFNKTFGTQRFIAGGSRS